MVIGQLLDPPEARIEACRDAPRWHDDDLAGRIVRQLDAIGRPYRILSLPAQAGLSDPLGRTPGEWLWDDGDYGYGMQLRQRKAECDVRTWASLYQQQPTPEGGAYSERGWLKLLADPPPREGMNVYGASDYAVTRDGGDYTVHIVVGIDPKGDMHILDLWRKQADSGEWIAAWCDLVKKWRPLEWAEETGQIRAALGPMMEAAAREAHRQTAADAGQVGLAMRSDLPSDLLAALDPLSRELADSRIELMRQEEEKARQSAAMPGDVLRILSCANQWSLHVTMPRERHVDLTKNLDAMTAERLAEKFVFEVYEQKLTRAEVGDEATAAATMASPIYRHHEYALAAEPTLEAFGRFLAPSAMPPAWMLAPGVWIRPTSGSGR